MELVKEFSEWTDQLRLGHAVRAWLKEEIPCLRRYRLWNLVTGWWAGRNGYDNPEPDGDKPTQKPYRFTQIEQKMKRLFAELSSGHPIVWQKLQAMKNHFDARLQEICEHIGDLTRAATTAGGVEILCMKPTVSMRQYLTWLGPIAAGEFVFSAVSFAYSGVMENFLYAIVLAAVMTLLILGLAHSLGRHVRSLPLAPSASAAERVRARIWIAVLGLATILLLGGITMIRVRGLATQGADLWSTMPLFLMGLTLAVAAVYLADQSEYSGPKHGMAALERRRRRIRRYLFIVEGWQKGVSEHREKLQTQVQCLEQELKYAYLAAYQFARRGRLKAEHRKQQKQKQNVLMSREPTTATADPAGNAKVRTVWGSGAREPNQSTSPSAPDFAPAGPVSRGNGDAGPAAHLAVLLLVLTLGLEPLTGCHAMATAPSPDGLVQEGGPHASSTQPCPAIEFLVDQSRSMNAAQRLKLYEYIHKVVATLRPCERVIVETVGGATTLSNPEGIYDGALPALPFYRLEDVGLTENPRQLRDNCRKQFPGQYATFKESLPIIDNKLRIVLQNPPKSQWTYLLDGVAEAAANLQEESGAKTLIILSDALEDSIDENHFHWDFANPAFWQRYDNASLLKRLNKTGRIPKLTGVTVYFVGAAADTSATYSRTDAFWTDFFAAVGAKKLYFGHSPKFREPPTPEFDRKDRCGGS